MKVKKLSPKKRKLEERNRRLLKKVETRKIAKNLSKEKFGENQNDTLKDTSKECIVQNFRKRKILENNLAFDTPHAKKKFKDDTTLQNKAKDYCSSKELKKVNQGLHRSNTNSSGHFIVESSQTTDDTNASKMITCTFNQDKLLTKFKTSISQTANNICNCCGGVFYNRSIQKICEDELLGMGASKNFLKSVFCVDSNMGTFCTTCRTSIVQLKTPKLALSNGLNFPEMNNVLKDLSPLEERLIAPRLPFMQIRLIGCGQQSSLRGNVVNVENNLDVCAKVLPRNFNKTSTVQVQLMRKMSYKKPYMYETIRPYKVYEAAKYLVTREAYMQDGISLCSDWAGYSEDHAIQFNCNSEESEPILSDEDSVNDFVFDDTSQNQLEDSSNLDNAIVSEQTGADETLIFDNFDGVKIAPAEGNRPLSLSCDTYSEELSFPSVYCGKKRNLKIALSYTDIAKSEIRRYDRRACKPTKVLYSFKKSYNEKVRNAVQFCYRKNNNGITARQAQNSEFLKSIITRDEGYEIFKNIRSSPSYWKSKTQTVMAMVRQLGKCTFFITLSAAETKWPELLVNLKKLLHNKDITVEEAMGLSFEEKNDLIKNDPVTCMRHFDHRYRELLKLVLKPPEGIFAPNKLNDYFARLEFQKRGSPHSHGLYWIENAPEFDENDEASHKKCCEFIDKYITCNRVDDGPLGDVVAYQLHKHSQSCLKKIGEGDTCRFHFPRPPMNQTVILTPLPKDFDEDKRSQAEKLFKRIKQVLIEMGKSFKDDVPFEEFLNQLETNRDAYILAIRSSIKRNTVFLKRSTNAIYVNDYNETLLLCWGANIDFQFVVDTYACVRYCVGYVLKCAGGVSKLFRAAINETKRNNLGIRERLNKYANILINGSEISAQEAAAFILQIPNTFCSRTDIYINTSLPHERTKVLKQNEELKKLDSDSLDVFSKGLLDHYIQRPEDLDRVCLAEFASMYTISKRLRQGEKDSVGRRIKLLDGSGFIKKRVIPRVIRFRNFSQNNNEYDHHREKIMLFVPWRDEESEILNIDCFKKATEYKNMIETNSQPFYHNKYVSDLSLNEMFDSLSEESEKIGGNFNSINLDNEDYVVNEDCVGGTRAPKEVSFVEGFRPPSICDEELYVRMMRRLNEKQRRLVLHVVRCFKEKITLRMFLSGGAGVGKSEAINAIVQTILRYSSKNPVFDPKSSPVIVGAPTGKAAFNVHGLTLHCIFRLPPNNSTGKFCDLSDSVVNSLRLKLKETQLFIIDEISMVSVRQLYEIDHRLRQIFATSEPFGNKSILVVGHLRQLPPVAGRYVFENPSHLPLGDLIGNWLWNLFSLYELTEIMRQKDDRAFCKALNNMAEGSMDNEDINLIRSREISNPNVVPNECIWLFATNEQCRIHNLNFHNTLGTEGCISTAIDTVEGKGTEYEKNALKIKAESWTTDKCDGVPFQTRLQLEAIYFVSTNIDVEDGLFNGATGVLKQIDYSTNGKPIRAWMKFEHPRIGIQKRKITEAHQIKHNIDLSWVAIEKIRRNLNKAGHHGLTVIRKQIPLIAANGMTINKAQGSSMAHVVVDLTQKSRFMSRERLYVACSRATTLQGLYIKGTFTSPKAPKENDKVSMEMARLRENPYLFALQFLQDFDSNFLKIYFHNVQTFLPHIKDICADKCAMASDLIVLVEPHLLETDVFEVSGFRVLFKKCCQKNRNSEGILVLQRHHKEDVGINVVHCELSEFSGHYIILKVQTVNLQCYFVYKSPRYPKARFIEALKCILETVNVPTVFIGDFNINLLTEDGDITQNLFEKYGFLSSLPKTSSTIGGTQIDCCFVNDLSRTKSWIYETYYSYHKPICFVWK